MASSTGPVRTFSTDRLDIRPYKESDLENSVELYGDSSITGHFDHGKPRSREETVAMIKKIATICLDGAPSTGLYTACLKGTNTFVGHFDILPQKGTPGGAAFGYIIRKEFHGKGFGTEIAKAAVDIFVRSAFKEKVQVGGKPLRTLHATVHPENPGSKRLLEKVGMQQVGETTVFHNKPRLVYALDLATKFSSEKRLAARL